MMRRDYEEERQKNKKRCIGALLLIAGVLLITSVSVFAYKRGRHTDLKNSEQLETQEDVSEEETEPQDIQNVMETESMWEDDNGPDIRDVPEDIDAAYQQEHIEGGTE